MGKTHGGGGGARARADGGGVRVAAIGGLDPSGGAGLLADAEAIRAAGGVPRALATALTAQGEVGFFGAWPVGPGVLERQLRAIGRVDAVKTGMLATAELVEVLVARIEAGTAPAPVVDPVLRASSGAPLLDDDGVAALRERLLPRAAAVTPNLEEAALLTGRAPGAVGSVAQMEDAARALVDAGVALAVITGGHLGGATLIDVGLARGEATPWRVERARVPGTARGTGCRFAAALATRRALGDPARVAVRWAGEYVGRYVAAAGAG